MRRRDLLKLAATLPLVSSGNAQTAKPAFRRVRPGEPGWPSAAQWQELRAKLGDQLIEVRSPLSACAANPTDAACATVFKGLKNPYYIRDNVALTQTSGWAEAWTSKPSVWAVPARNS